MIDPCLMASEGKKDFIWEACERDMAAGTYMDVEKNAERIYGKSLQNLELIDPCLIASDGKKDFIW